MVQVLALEDWHREARLRWLAGTWDAPEESPPSWGARARDLASKAALVAAVLAEALQLLL